MSNLTTTAWASNGRDVEKIEGPLDPKQLKDYADDSGEEALNHSRGIMTMSHSRPYKGFKNLRLQRYWFDVPGTTMHINTWEGICTDLGVDPDEEGNYPEYLSISAIVYAEGSRNDEY